jgi:putative ABC transport system permease protein
MSVLESFLTAIDSLRANKMRTLLTMLGVIIGVGAVITMIGIAQGARQATLEQVQRLGANVLTVRPGQARRGGAFLGFGSVQSLKLEDGDAILKSCGELVARVSPEVWTTQQVKYLNRNMRTSVSGVTPELQPIRNLVLEEGRFVNEQDMEGMARVAVIGHTVWQELFQGGACVGKTIRIGGQSYEVIGRIAYKGDTGFRSFDDRVYIPLPTAMRRLMGQRHLDALNVQARRSDQMAEAQTCIEDALMKAHKIPPWGDPDFRVFNQGDFVETVEATAQVFTFLLAGVALVSLIVGGIGIMNIMLVSVTERTREIGSAQSHRRDEVQHPDSVPHRVDCRERAGRADWDCAGILGGRLHQRAGELESADSDRGRAVGVWVRSVYRRVFRAVSRVAGGATAAD